MPQSKEKLDAQHKWAIFTYFTQLFEFQPTLNIAYLVINKVLNTLQHALGRKQGCTVSWLDLYDMKFLLNHIMPKIVSEYDQEIPQSKTADQPMAS